ncbi:unnamed protein product, partial [Mesorhabditis spiculigera]
MLLRETALQQLFANGITFECANFQHQYQTGPNVPIEAVGDSTLLNKEHVVFVLGMDRRQVQAKLRAHLQACLNLELAEVTVQGHD